MAEEQNKGVETAGKQAEDKKQNSGNKSNAVQKAQKATKVIGKFKNFAIFGPAIGIFLIIILLIGLIAFFFTMPGLFLENIKEVAKTIWNNFLDAFNGSSSVDRRITEEQEIELVQRIQAMGYDISGYGFADIKEKDDNGNIIKIGPNNDDKNYIRTYLVAEESTYSIANWSDEGNFKALWDTFINFDGIKMGNEYSQGMIALPEKGPAVSGAVIDRDKEMLYIDQSMSLLTGTFYFSLSDWTNRYGKPIELLLSLHLATMMPDLSYDIVSQFNTKVNIDFEQIDFTFVVEYITENGETLNSEDILEIERKIDESKKKNELGTPLPGPGDVISSPTFSQVFNDSEDEEITLEDTELAELTEKQFEALVKLAKKGKKGDFTYWPMISTVKNHWFYETIDFRSVYERTSSSNISLSYTPRDENDELEDLQDKINLEITLNNMIVQVREPIAKGPNQKIKDIFLNNKYYRYDGTETRAQAIENARAIDTGKNQYIYKGQWYDVQDRTVEKEPVNFHTSITMPDGTEIKSTKNALSAFSLLEGMHTEASEQIYRNLQELVIDLGYFTEEDFAVPSTQVLEWILPDHIPPMWAIRDVNEYGAFIRSEVNLEDGFEAGKKVIAPADATVLEITDNSIKLKLKSIDDKTLQALQETLGKENENITLDPNCILDMEFLINGIDTKDGLTGDIKRGDEIGTTTDEDIHIIMYNIDKSVVDNIEDYMQPNYKGYGSASAGQWFNPDYNINIEEVQKEVYKKLESYNLTDEAIFVVMGVMQAESGFDVSIDNILPDGSSDGGHGLLQWTGGRRTNLENFCKNNGYQVDSVEGQLEFFIYELEKSYSKKNGYAYPVYETLMTSHDMEECLEMFFSHAEAGYDIPIADDYIYNHNFDITTQELYDMRLTYAVAFSKKQSELES